MKQRLAMTLNAKTETFKVRFYLSVEADLSDISDKLESSMNSETNQSHLLELISDFFIQSVNILDSTNAEKIS